MLNDAPNINALWSNLIVEELVRCGVRTFCISPGSRSAPLTLAAADHDGALKVVHFDERGSAFHALGIAKATRTPVALICSSGTALANFMPAVVEASMSSVPLILLTADRPPELQDTGANQTIDQVKFFGDYVRWQHALPCPDEHVPPESVLSVIDQAIYRATASHRGPVHINCMFREPLAPEPADFDQHGYMVKLGAWTASERPLSTYSSGRVATKYTIETGLLASLAKTRRGIVLAGQMSSRSESEAGAEIAATLGWPLIADVTSGLRLTQSKADTIHYADAMLAAHDTAITGLESVLHLGGAITSKRVMACVSTQRPAVYARVAVGPRRLDPDHLVTHRVDADIAAFAESLGPIGDCNIDTGWVAGLVEGSERAGKAITHVLSSQDGLSEVGVVRAVSELAPADGVLFIGNSMPIRHCDAYGVSEGNVSIVAANRGASGIDGNIATAAGYARGLGKTVTLVLGDLAFLHDINSLALIARGDAPVIIVVLNNNGGGIFSWLPVAAYPRHFEAYFSTPHGMGFENVAAGFQIGHERPETSDEFSVAYRTALNEKKPAIIEVRTDIAAQIPLQRLLVEGLQA